MNALDITYKELLMDIMANGVEKSDRTGTGTISVFGRQIRHKMSEGYPLLTTKKMAFKTMVTELLWFLKGDTNIKYLVDNGCNIWNGDAYKRYYDDWLSRKNNEWSLTKEEFIDKIKTNNEFAKKWGELGPIYGKQWRKWHTGWDVVEDRSREAGVSRIEHGIDQIQEVIDTLKTKPDSRRMLVSAWNVNYLDEMVLPPCHYGFQVYTRELSLNERIDYALSKNDFRFTDDIINDEDYEKYNIPTRAISLMFNMRSNDVPLGLPFNIASYGLLLEIISKMVNMVPDELIVNLGDAHIYKNQVDGVKEQLTREPMKLPNLIISDEVNFNGTINEFLESCNKDSFKLNGYESHPSIKMPLSN